MGENIGATARAMLNFGFDDLRIVSPRDGWPNSKAIEMSAGASRVIENAKVFDSTEEAIADLKFIYATTARRRDLDKTLISSNQIQQQEGLGVLFGAERSGLENDDIALANAIVTIPVSEEYKSLNLATSVAIICYELSKKPMLEKQREIATKEELNSFFEHLETELSQANFFSVDDKKPGMMRNIKTMFTRADFSSQEVRTLHGIIKSLKK